MKTAYASILNRLHEMQQSPYYASAHGTRASAGHIIVQLEKERNDALAKVTADKEEIERLRDALHRIAAYTQNRSDGYAGCREIANAVLIQRKD